MLYVGNGFDNTWVYDGSGDNLTWELGSCKALLTAGGSNLDTAAAYKYQVTINTDVYICGAISNTATTDAGNRKVTLSNIPLGPAGTANRKIFRTEGGGSTYKLLTTIADNSTTTYIDDIADGSLGATIGAVTDDFPKGAELRVHRERFFITRDPSDPNKIYYSNPYLPHYIQQTVNLDYMEIEPNDNDEISGIPIQLGIMCCIKKNTIRKLHITSPVSGADPTTWYADDPIVFSGCPAPWSIVQTAYGVAYLGWDHWYVFNGSQSIPILEEFDTGEILPADYNDTVSYYDPKDLLLAAYTDQGAAEQVHDKVLFYSFKRKALALDNVKVNCFGSRDGDDENGELYYGGSDNGYVYKTTDAQITYQLRTKTEANAGTLSNIFVGGTESSPYIEVGGTTSASTIPDDICIFWDNSATNPGSGWTEITSHDGTFPKVKDAAVGTEAAISISGGTETTVPFIDLRIFKKNNTTSEYIFPDGAVVMYDQSTTPAGYATIASGKYIRINSDLDDPTGLDVIPYFPEEEAGAAENLDNFAEFRLIKKLGEQNTWGGVDQYVYCLYYTTGAPGNDWSNVSSTYDGFFLKSASDDGTTLGGDTANEVDYMQFDSTLHSTIWNPTSGAITEETGGEEDIYDGDLDSAMYAKVVHSADGSCIADGTSQHTWDTGVDLDSIYMKFRINNIPWGNYANGNYKYKTEYRDSDAVWQTLEDSGTINAFGDNTFTKTYSAGYTGVTGLRCYIYGDAYSYEGNRQQWVQLWFYEMKALSTQTESSTFNICKKVLGKMQDFNSAIGSHQGAGTWTSPSVELKAESLDKIFWNEILTGADTVEFYTRTGATKAAAEAAGWSAVLSNPNGSVIASSADEWLQYKMTFTAADTTANIPRVYFTDGYAVKISYHKGTNNAETTVEFIYEIGVRNFDLPMADKVFKKIQTVHNGSDGLFLVKWVTENSSGTFTVDLTQNSQRWDSFFPDSAMGRDINFTIYKNDAYNFKLKELQGLYAPEPIIV